MITENDVREYFEHLLRTKNFRFKYLDNGSKGFSYNIQIFSSNKLQGLYKPFTGQIAREVIINFKRRQKLEKIRKKICE